MSRFALVCSLVFGLSVSLVNPADAQFARAPEVASLDRGVADPVAGAELRVAPYRTADRATVRALLAKARGKNHAAFRVYQKKGTFPSNTYADRKLNVWIDENGHLCAAATIISMSGHRDLVMKVKDQNNFIRLGDVQQGPLMDWMLTSGFTQAELAMIQEPFMPVVDEPVMEPSRPIVVDAKLRKAENARLAAKYKTIDKKLVQATRTSLDRAVDKLMKRPDLVSQLLDASA
jgi:hypothetical protein